MDEIKLLTIALTFRSHSGQTRLWGISSGDIPQAVPQLASLHQRLAAFPKLEGAWEVNIKRVFNVKGEK